MYFTEFNFCFTDQPGTIYWLPVLIDTDKITKAETVKTTIATQIANKFTLLKTHELSLYEKPFYSKTLSELVDAQQKVEVLKLNLKTLSVSNFEQEISLKLAAQYQIMPQTLLVGHRHTISSKLKRFGIVTTQFHNESDYEKEFIVMKFKPKPVE